MEHKKISVISIGYGQRLFEANDPDRLRMEACAKQTHAYNMVVLSSLEHGQKAIVGQNGLVIHPIASRFLLVKFVRSILLVRSLVKVAPAKVVVTAQDPFETGLVGWLATRLTTAGFNVQEHGDVFSTDFWKNETVTNSFRFHVGLFILRAADTVRVVSDRIITTLEKKGIKRTHISKLPVMIDTKMFAASQADKKVRDFFVPGSFIFLSVARFVPQKNLPLMLRAFIRAYRQNNNIRLLLVGDGPESALVKKIIADSNINESEMIIKILPWTNDVATLMASADAYVLSSNYEGWGRVLIEAVHAKLPIVTTDVGCANEEVFNNLHGLVVPVQDEGALASALADISSNNVAYKLIKQHLLTSTPPAAVSYDAYAKQWISLLQETAEVKNT